MLYRVLEKMCGYCIVCDTGETSKLFYTKKEPNCFAVAGDDYIIIGDYCKPMICIYHMDGELYQTPRCVTQPSRVSVCRSTGRIGVVYAKAEGVWVLCDKMQKLYASKLPCENIDFDGHGYLFLGDCDNKSIYVLNAKTGIMDVWL